MSSADEVEAGKKILEAKRHPSNESVPASTAAGESGHADADEQAQTGVGAPNPVASACEAALPDAGTPLKQGGMSSRIRLLCVRPPLPACSARADCRRVISLS